MAVKAKRFRIGVEGATTDGRNIERAWLEQMAASYDPQVYTALINLEHIKGYTPDSPFRRFGTVDKLEAEEIADGPLKGKIFRVGHMGNICINELALTLCALERSLTALGIQVPPGAAVGAACAEWQKG